MLVDNHSVKYGFRGHVSSASVAFSEYYAGLTGPAKTRYREKVLMCGFDPYMLKKSECNEDLADYPGVEYPDIGY